jgi:hypothetical protein
VSATWVSIQVELVEGRGEDLWPRPGRILAAARRHTFAELATAIDDAFARWDRAHLHQFWLADGGRIGNPDPEWDDEEVLDETRLTLGRLKAGEQFVYEFDFGDSWLHLCTVGPRRIDPSSSSASSRIARCPTGDGAASQTSTAAGGAATMVRVRRPATLAARTYHASGRGSGEGDPR